jgi:hypothetical protein
LVGHVRYFLQHGRRRDPTPLADIYTYNYFLVAKPDHIVASSIQQQAVNNNEERVRGVGNTAGQRRSKRDFAKQLVEIAFLSDFKISPTQKKGSTAIKTAINYKDQAIVSAYYHHNFWQTTK